jgi:hypothetical protein
MQGRNPVAEGPRWKVETLWMGLVYMAMVLLQVCLPPLIWMMMPAFRAFRPPNANFAPRAPWKIGAWVHRGDRPHYPMNLSAFRLRHPDLLQAARGHGEHAAGVAPTP